MWAQVSTIMQETGQGVKASLMSSVITNSVNFGATFVAVFGVDRQGAVMPCVAFSVLLQLQRLQQPCMQTPA